ncbi:cyclohexanecarboxylate-CoA ligase [Neoroseomonas oryzicola]|uniref:3-methylmercaptopropionyl-CoA ligase n=1 Tax=Neoroseomonas oryzicola TaxID=535904 RepID=A0A9X9WFF9_9PROT|nr:cyclohexanecarboxylate-CoA ligase [Neoroseomonas oryzicola]MBR0659069.1 cyclohexanecarboxylate-CoA ligase [Neoroseomonas oryzicola]NKE17006.1 cyclohexanecarboxylate-CoA ligase [Neoroseomonas oryzicola]
MEVQKERLLARRAAMRAAGHWRDETLLDHLARAVAARPSHTAIVARRSETGEARRITYAELDRLSTLVAMSLRERGIGAGDVVSFQLPNWWEFSVLHLACLKLGAVSNPLMVIFRERELGFMLGLAESKVMVVPHRFRGFDYPAMVANVRDRLPALKHVVVAGGTGPDAYDTLLSPQGDPAAFRPAPPSPDDVIQLLYTSGTTGEPKGVMHSSNTMLSNLAPFAERLGLGAGDVIHMPSPLAHQLGFMYGIVLPVMLGGTAVLQDIFAPEEMARQIRDEGATFTMGATPFLNDLTEHVARTGEGTPSLRVFVSAGAPIPRALVAKARPTLGAAVVSAWGMSENGAVTTTYLDDVEEKATTTDGCPLPGMELRILDAEGGIAPSGEQGRLQVRGCSNFVGYLKRPELDTTDPQGWFDTGDLARMDPEGYIRIAGRSKDIIIRGGENIPVVEVEGLLFRHPAIAEVAVVGYPDDRLGERACAYVRLREGASLTLAEMTAYLQDQRMARQYMPERLEIVQELPRTPSGKIQKFRLREMARD